MLCGFVNLSLCNNLITNIPQNIGNLTLLIELSLDYNHITIVPASFGNLVSLNAVNLSHNLITSFEDDLANLWNVEIFNVSYNSLASLPNFTWPMNNLWWVILDHNNLTGLPESIYNQHILRISARDNSLSTLPDSLVWFNNSYLHLYLSGNNLLGGLNQDFEPPSYFVWAANNITPTGKRLYIQSWYGKFWIQN